MNEETIGDSYKLPRKDYILEKLKGNTYFSTFDAKSGYWQLRLDESTKPLTTFSCPPQKHYEWNVLPFGLKQEPSIYQRFIDNNLQGLENICLAYIDDIIVFTKGDEQEHIKAVSKVLQRIKEKGLVLSQKKSKLLQTEVEYLGLKIAKNGAISLTNNTQEKLKLFPDKLEDRKQIQRFLGCLNYIAEQGFLKNLAKERKLLQKKIFEKIRWEWTPADTELVQHIKSTVQYLPELYNPKTKDFFIVETDASDDTWAGCLKAIQNGKELLGLDIDGNQISQSQPSELSLLSNEQNSVLKTEKYNAKLCKYISGTFSQAEQNYSTHEKKHLRIQRISLTGFPAQSVGSSNTDVLDSPCLLVLITGTSQSRQHDSIARTSSSSGVKISITEFADKRQVNLSSDEGLSEQVQLTVISDIDVLGSGEMPDWIARDANGCP
ncbi:reverse transcriptase [Tanacetum coccineum]